MKNSLQRLKDNLGYVMIPLVLYLFYKSWLVLILLLPCIIAYRRIHKKDYLARENNLLKSQFKDMLESLVASLRAGYSMENALKECKVEMALMHGEDSPICKKLIIINNRLSVGISAEEAFNLFAEETKIEDIETFASVFSIAKRTGGDIVEIIRKTSEEIGEKIDTANEIAVVISSKKYEQSIMTMIPVGIILYIDLTSGGLLDPLYGNIPGILIMTACLGVYIGAILLGRRITDIEV